MITPVGATQRGAILTRPVEAPISMLGAAERASRTTDAPALIAAYIITSGQMQQERRWSRAMITALGMVKRQKKGASALLRSPYS